MSNTAPKKTSQKYWFRRKYYGWGWYPASWQGWVTLLFYIIILTLNAFSLDTKPLTPNQVWMRILPSTVILTVVLILICYQTGESPLWQWGGQPVTKKSAKPAPKKSITKSKSKSKKK